MLGEDGIRRWAALATLPMLATSKPGELVTLSIVRARFCELLAQLGGLAPRGDAFMMGMFSLLDALIDCPLDQALREIELKIGHYPSPSGNCFGSGLLAKIYKLTRRYEIGDWDEIDALAREIGVPPAAVGTAYVESTLWAERLLNGGM